MKKGSAIVSLIAGKIGRDYDPEKIILFGSYAWGKPGRDSDIDLLIVRESDKPFHKRWSEVSRIVSDLRGGVSISPFVLTPAEVKERLDKGDPFIKKILEEGKVLYG